MVEKWPYWLDELRRERNVLVRQKRAHARETAKISLPILQRFFLSVHVRPPLTKETAAAPQMAKTISAFRITAADMNEFERLSPAFHRVVEPKTILAEMEPIGHWHKHSAGTYRDVLWGSGGFGSLLRCWNLAEQKSHGRRHHSHHRAIKEEDYV